MDPRDPEQKGFMQKKRRLKLNLITNLGLLLAGAAMAISGFVMQFGYHMGHHGNSDENNPVLGMYYSGWSNSHKISIVIASLLIIVHIVLHWEWYKTIITKKLLARNKFVITLTIIFMIVGVTGYIPWFVKLWGGSDWTRKIFVEIHDKMTFLLFVCLVIHVTKRFRWFVTAFAKIKKSGD